MGDIIYSLIIALSITACISFIIEDWKKKNKAFAVYAFIMVIVAWAAFIQNTIRYFKS